MVYTVTLNPALDYIIKLKRLSDADINRSLSERICYGGKGINVSAVLKQLGIDTTALGFIGGFTGQELERMLLSDGINTDFCTLKSGNTRVNVKLSSVTEYDINTSGPNIDSSELDALMAKTDGIKSGDHLVLAGSVPSSVPHDIYERILHRQKGKDVLVTVDTTGDALMSTLEHKPFLIKPNHIELGELFGTEISDDSEAVYYGRKLQKLGAQNVLVSCAESGAILIGDDGICLKTTNADGKFLSSVGCGDSMVAGFIAGRIKTNDNSYALALGTAAGNATAFCEGLANADGIKKIFDTDIKIEILK